jgi:hypothetical protein
MSCWAQTPRYGISPKGRYQARQNLPSNCVSFSVSHVRLRHRYCRATRMTFPFIPKATVFSIHWVLLRPTFAQAVRLPARLVTRGRCGKCEKSAGLGECAMIWGSERRHPAMNWLPTRQTFVEPPANCLHLSMVVRRHIPRRSRTHSRSASERGQGRRCCHGPTFGPAYWED